MADLEAVLSDDPADQHVPAYAATLHLEYLTFSPCPAASS